MGDNGTSGRGWPRGGGASLQTFHNRLGYPRLVMGAVAAGLVVSSDDPITLTAGALIAAVFVSLGILHIKRPQVANRTAPVAIALETLGLIVVMLRSGRPIGLLLFGLLLLVVLDVAVHGGSAEILATRRAKAELARALRLEEEAGRNMQAVERMRDQFLRAVAHDLRGPLAAILALAQLLKDRAGELEPAKARAAFETLGTASAELNESLQDLLEVGALYAGQTELVRNPTDLRVLIERAVTDRGGHDTEMELEDVVLNVDPQRVERLVGHLLKVAAGRAPHGTKIGVKLRATDDGALISVEDLGPPIDLSGDNPSDDPFDFVEAEGPRPGIWTSLFLVSRFAQIHGGRAQGKRIGAVTSFTVTLPRG